MRFLLGAAAILALCRSASAQNEVPVGTVEGRIVEGTTLQPVEGATVVLTDAEKGPVVASGTTDSDGRFRYKVPPGVYDVLAIFGEARWIHLKTKVERGKIVQVPGVLNLDGEVVTIHDKAPAAHRAPEAVRSTVKNILPYSDEAIDQNAWAVGWVLLDVSEAGLVTAFRFLHRPGYKLEAIAEREIWGLRFKPAVDAGGNPMVSKVLWKLEWPAFHWAQSHKLLGTGGEGALTPANESAATRDAQGVQSPSNSQTSGMMLKVSDNPGVASGNPLTSHDVLPANWGLGGLTGANFVLPEGVHKPPCRGSGPLNLDNHETMYRDCTPPDLGNVNREAPIVRPAQ